jgi:hypothetical protein
MPYGAVGAGTQNPAPTAVRPVDGCLQCIGQNRSQDPVLGDSSYTFWEEYCGRIDDVMVYDYGLQQSDINAIYEQGM